MIIRLKTFTGEFPRLRPTALPDHAAQIATDCEFRHGTLTGIKSGAVVSGAAAGAKSIFVHEPTGATYSWTRDVDAVRSPLPSDAHSRFYWSDGTNFYASVAASGGSGEPSSDNKWKVGVPRPSAAPTLGSRAFALPIVPGSLVITRADERMDGTLANETKISSPTMTSEANGTSATWTFTAASPASGGGGVEIENEGDTSDGAPLYMFGQQMNVGSAASPEFVDIMVFNQATATRLANGTLTDHVANPMFFMYDFKGTDPKAVRARFSLTIGGTTTENVYTFHRLGSHWYSTDPAQTRKAVVKAKQVEVDSPFAGAVVTLRMVDSTTKAEYTAKLRSNSTFNEWPDELSSYGATMTITPSGKTATYKIVIAAKPSALEARTYTFTWVNTWGEEGPPSDVLFIEDCVENATVGLTLPAAPKDYRPIGAARLYRTATGSGTEFQFVAEYAVSGGMSITDSARKQELGETLSTYNYYPPAQDLKGICVMPNGMLAGFRDNEIHIMEPYLPYACDPNSIKPLPHKIMGICPTEGGLFVTTTAEPYILMGASPDTITDVRGATVQGGVSKGSITSINGRVVYATNDGIVLANGLDADLSTSFQFFTRDVWRSLYGSKLSLMRFAHHDGSLVVWFTDGAPGFLMRFEEESPSMVKLTEAITAAYVHRSADALYISTGSAVYSFGAGAAKAFIWRSKDFVLPKQTNFGVIQMFGSGTASVLVIADGATKITIAATLAEDGVIYRLPADFLARTWSVRIEGAAGCDVREVILATSVPELANV